MPAKPNATMEGNPYGFFILLLGIFAGALILTIAAFVVKQRRLQRLKDPHRDYYRERG